MTVRTKLWLENVLFLKLYLWEQLEIHQLKKPLSLPYDIKAYIINLPILWILYLIPYIIFLELQLPSYDSVTRYTRYSCFLVVRGRKGQKRYFGKFTIFQQTCLDIVLFSCQPRLPKLTHCNLHLILNITQEWRVMLQTVTMVEGWILSGVVLEICNVFDPRKLWEMCFAKQPLKHACNACQRSQFDDGYSVYVS